jgi:heme/copper-type cytochrome/quinol oxidase subunit 2
MIVNLVTGLIVILFLLVAAFLGYGAYSFGRRGESVQQGKANMAREVVWTGLASLLLLGLFLYAHP